MESGDDIVFLHELQPGPPATAMACRWRAWPACRQALIRQARATLEALKPLGSRATSSSTSLPPHPHRPPAPEPDPIQTALSALDPDALTLREALDALYRLKALAR